MLLPLKKIGCLVAISVYSLCTYSQHIEPGSTFKTIDQDKYFRLQYDNDFFTKSDEYYTQGILLEYGNPGLKNFILSDLLIGKIAGEKRYSIGINHAAYTPTSIRSDEILYGDRPFAACISFSTSVAVTNEQKASRLVSSFTIGVIGPAAQGKEIQTGIHRWLKNVLPHGWQYQIKNDAILNYDVTYEKKLYQPGQHFLLNVTGSGSFGSFSDKLSAGFNFITGNFNDPYQSKWINRKKIQYYFYGQGRANFTGYDATLQGGLFNHNSPYTISSGDITRGTFEADAGIIANFRKVWLSYSQSFLSKEFNTGNYHRWGGISVGVAF